MGFGLSLAVSPLLLFAGGTLIRTVDIIQSSAIIAASLAGLLALYSRERWKISVSRVDGVILALVLVHLVTLELQFLGYPIFPRTSSVDYSAHLQRSLWFASGTVLPTEVNYPPSVHLLIAAGLGFLGGEPIVSMQQSMILLASLTPLLLFAASSRLFRDSRIAIGVSTFYVFTGGLWYQGLFISGLYANFLANLLTFTVLILLIENVERPSVRLKAMLPLVGLAFYLSHFTPALFLIALWLFCPIAYFAHISIRRYVEGLLLVTIPAIPIVVVRPYILRNLLNLPFAEAGNVSYIETPLTGILSLVSPFLLYLSIEMMSIPTFLFALIAVPVAAYLVFRSGLNVWVKFVFFWFFLIWAITPYEAMAWRFAYYAILPLTFLLGFLGVSIVVSSWRRLGLISSKRRRQRIGVNSMISGIGLVLTVCVIFLYGSPLNFMVSDLSGGGIEKTRSQQLAMYDTVKWVDAHLPSNSTIIVVTGLDTLAFRDRFQFVRPLAENKFLLYSFFGRPGDVEKSGADYVAVTFDLSPNYDGAVGLERLYSSEVMSIYRIVR